MVECVLHQDQHRNAAEARRRSSRRRGFTGALTSDALSMYPNAALINCLLTSIEISPAKRAICLILTSNGLHRISKEPCQIFTVNSLYSTMDKTAWTYINFPSFQFPVLIFQFSILAVFDQELVIV